MASTTSQELRKFVAPEFVFGSGARNLSARYVRKLGGRRVFLVTDPGVVAAGWGPEIQTLLEEDGLEVNRYDHISPNPRDFQVMEGTDHYLATRSDVLVAVGGGSAMDCAKGIGIVVSNGGSILDYQGVDCVPIPMPPLVCIPTTGGTSADVSQFAIINDPQEQVKIAIISKAVVPDVALIDPVTLTTMDPYLTACTGMDALVHAVEAFVSNAASPITDPHALAAIRLISNSLRASVANPDNLELRTDVMMASLQAGLAFSNASLGCVHAMAHSLGGFKDLPHGECNALLLAHVIEYNYSSAPERYGLIGEAFGLDFRSLNSDGRRKLILNALRSLRLECGIQDGLRARGVHPSDLARLAAKAIEDPCNATNPRPPTRGDLQTVYEEAL